MQPHVSPSHLARPADSTPDLIPPQTGITRYPPASSGTGSTPLPLHATASEKPTMLDEPATDAPESLNRQPIPPIKLQRHPENGWSLSSKPVNPTQPVAPLVDSSLPFMCPIFMMPVCPNPNASLLGLFPGSVLPQVSQWSRSSSMALHSSLGSLVPSVLVPSQPGQFLQSCGLVPAMSQSGQP